MSSSSTETLVDVTMPQMGVSVAEGTVVEWKKHPGDWIERDEIICAISTDKIDTDVESPAAGRVQEILVDVGKTVDVGVVLARIATDAKPGEAHAAEGVAGDGAARPSAEQTAETGTGEATAALQAPGEAGELQGDAAPRPARRPGARRYSPVVQRIAAEHGIDLERVEGTGRGGRVRKQDVLAFLERGEAAEEPPLHIESPYRPDEPAAPPKAPAPAPEPAFAEAGIRESGPLSRMRKSIGEHMHRSLQTAATCTSIIEADMTRIEAARAKLGLTYLPFVARCTIDALREFPSLNATLEGDTFTTYDDVNLGIAVSLGQGGLIVPVIHRAQEYSVEGLGTRIRDLARKARNNELSPDDVRSGTFTITNPGGYGTIMATPVINQPQVAILDTEAVVRRPVVITDERGNDSIAIRHMTYFCMSWDHRALDGAQAAQFLAELRKRVEAWSA